jgi:Xaa-Pro dipeptidase
VLRRLRDALPDEAARGVLLLQGGKTLPVDATDGEILFRQEAFFHHLFGANEDGLYGTLDVRSGKSAVYVPRLPAEYGVWMGKLQPPSYYQAKYGVDAAHYVDELPAALEAAGARVLHVLSGVNSDSGLDLPRVAFDGDAAFEYETAAALPALREARAHKTRGELDAIAYVNRLGSEAHVLMMRAAKAGAMEYQLESVFRHHTYSAGGCRNQGYTPIVASGANGAVLHYGHAGAPNDRQLRDGDMMLLDCGEVVVVCLCVRGCFFVGEGAF